MKFDSHRSLVEDQLQRLDQTEATDPDPPKCQLFCEVAGAPVVSIKLLSMRTGGYQRLVEAYAANHIMPTKWAEKGVRKEDHVRR